LTHDANRRNRCVANEPWLSANGLRDVGTASVLGP
jgi:hypothetical protein